jgi:hypothetical protein
MCHPPNAVRQAMNPNPIKSNCARLAAKAPVNAKIKTDA